MAEEVTRAKRRKSNPENKNLCIICQTSGNKKR